MRSVFRFSLPVSFEFINEKKLLKYLNYQVKFLGMCIYINLKFCSAIFKMRILKTSFFFFFWFYSVLAVIFKFYVGKYLYFVDNYSYSSRSIALKFINYFRVNEPCFFFDFQLFFLYFFNYLIWILFQCFHWLNRTSFLINLFSHYNEHSTCTFLLKIRCYDLHIFQNGMKPKTTELICFKIFLNNFSEDIF